MEDPLGDVALETGGVPIVQPTGSPTDMHALTIDETPKGFHIWMAAASTGDPTVYTEADVTFYDVWFSFHGTQYNFVMTLGTTRDEVAGQDTNLWRHGTRLWDVASDQVIARGDVTIDGDQVGGFIPRELIVDRDGATPGIGDTFEDLWATARSLYIATGISSHDRMPDTGTETYTVTQGTLQTGHARLASPVPMRQSNGGAGTWIYEVIASNLAEEDTFTLGLDDVPVDWEVHLPFETMTFSGQQTFPVLVVTPFGHSHGDAERFNVTLTSHRDSSAVGRLQLGILYPTIPQPAGHHPTLWLHSQTRETGLDPAVEVSNGWNPGKTAYMNALAEESNDERIPIPGRDASMSSAAMPIFDWDIPLTPSLDIGLDFLLGQTGRLDATFRSMAPLDGAVVSGEVVHVGRESITLASVATSDPFSVGAGEGHAVALDVTPTPESDLVPFEDGAGLVLRLYMQAQSSAADGPVTNPELMPGASLELPLQEYRDPVGSFAEVAEGLRFPSGLTERSINPGRTAVIPVTIYNDGADTEVILTVAGVMSDWASAPQAVFVPRGGEATVEVLITAPAAAENGTVADLVLMAESEERPFDHALSKLIVTVVSGVDIPDQTPHAPSQASPGLGPIALLASVLLVRRR